MRKVKVAIIGAGSAGLSARREVAKVTDDYLVFDDGPLGTTCARVGCMPSKVLIQIAHDFHRRHQFTSEGIHGGESLHLSQREVMAHVRRLRDRFVQSVVESFESWQDKLICDRVRFISPQVLQVGEEQIEAEAIIVATGSESIIPQSWLDFQHRFLTSESIFEQQDFPQSLCVIGLGVIGIELGQALSRLGVNIEAVTLGKSIGGLTDPQIQDYALKIFRQEFSINTHGVKQLRSEPDRLEVVTDTGIIRAEQALVSIGRRPRFKGLGLNKLGLKIDENDRFDLEPGTFQVKGESIFVVGDVNGQRPVLHEASDEGRIAGYNAVRLGQSSECFQRRTALTIVFCEPQIALVGQTYQELTQNEIDFVTGKVCFEGYGRAIVKLEEVGLVHIYAERDSGRILGAELFCPDAEHLAHQLAWVISLKLSVAQVLALPFYHPVMEEGLRTALRDAADQINTQHPPLEMLRCQETIVLRG
ncbi:dihydrolipoyl dehydrogenase [Pleurocapsales cyanobacterium LEGE 10410]|nr:dihydrolipoyl dehydrogenase [Pleurocapsales cyanobacterium LEGE 10410]